MKKVISILLVLVIALSLCACGESVKEGESVKKAVVGIWEYEYNWVDAWNQNRHGKKICEFYEDGTGRYYYIELPSEERGSTWTFDWDVKESTIVAHFYRGDNTDIERFTYDFDSNTVTELDEGNVFIKVSK